MAHRIEVDDEVMALLKSKAEAFVDTPNTVLRRLLFENGPGGAPANLKEELARSGVVPQVRRETPKALEHILQVAYLTRKSNRTRVQATHEVARHHGVAFQTVLDKYSRQLNLTTDEFDAMLEEPNLARLMRLLTSKFDRHTDVIVEILK